jgi:hypothetical protein
MKMFFSKKKKRKSGVKKKQRFNLKDFFTIPVTSLTLISLMLISSFIFQLSVKEKQKTSIIDFEKLLRKNSYEKKTGHRIQIEILNGCGQRYIAKMYQDFLRYEGYDVMDAKNAGSKYEHTTVYLHRGDPEMALHLSSVVGVNDSLIIKRIDESLMFDVSIVIGNDFTELDSYNSAIPYHPNKLLILD